MGLSTGGTGQGGGQGDSLEDVDVASQLGTHLGQATRKSLFEGMAVDVLSLPVVPALECEIHRSIVFHTCPVLLLKDLVSPVHHFSHNSVSLAP